MLARLRKVFKRWQRENRARVLVRFAAIAYHLPRQVRDLVLSPLVIRELRRTAQDRNSDAVVNQICDGFHRVFKPIQVRDEFVAMARKVAEVRPRRILEIGTANGATLFALTRVAADDAVVVSVDLPGGWFGGGYPRWKTLLYRRFAVAQQQIHLMRGDSHQPEMYSKVRRVFGDNELDVLFIDGDHTYEGVRRDYEAYGTLVKPGGMIIFHDILKNRWDSACQVDRFWNEVKSAEGIVDVEEHVADRNQGCAGIGLLRTVSQFT